MKILTFKQGCEWMQNEKDHSFIDLTPDRIDYKYKMRFDIPADSGYKTYIARSIISELNPLDGSVLCIREYGIWTTSENIDLFRGYRSSLKEFRSLVEAPFHIADNNDTSKMESLLCMVLYFVWGCTIVNADCSLIIKFSHDEYVWVLAKNEAVFTSFQSIFTVQE